MDSIRKSLRYAVVTCAIVAQITSSAYALEGDPCPWTDKQGCGMPLRLVACSTTSVMQKFNFVPVGDNITNGTSIILKPQNGVPASCMNGDCCVNVMAWGTHVGAIVWATHCGDEAKSKELSRAFLRTEDGAIVNPTSDKCLGLQSGPGKTQIVLVECGDALHFDIDTDTGTISEQCNYGLCLELDSTKPKPTPSPPPAPPSPPFPSTIRANANVGTAASIATSADTMVSFNLDWHKNEEEWPVWVNASALILDLDNPLLRATATALSPAMLRIGGSEGDVLCYDVPEYNSTCADMNQTDPAMCLNMARFLELGKFAASTGNKIAFGLNAIWGRPNQDIAKPLDLSNIRALLTFAAKNDMPIYGWELGNEKPKIPAEVMAQDYHNLKKLIVELWPDVNNRPKLIGNDCNANPGYLNSWLPLVADVLDVLTYHHYDGYGLDPNLGSQILTPKFLDGTVQPEVNAAHKNHAPHTQLWVGEAAAAWHSGRDGVTNAFASSFWYADALGGLSARGHSGYCRQVPKLSPLLTCAYNFLRACVAYFPTGSMPWLSAYMLGWADSSELYLCAYYDPVSDTVWRQLWAAEPHEF
eukprot:m.1520979 g.1520979  ORF g.1520979 m.1520979 type:complete len:586 (-) comp25229_c0_seq4:3871-5628(-)